MTALGRVLQVIGWVWVAVGLFGPLLDLPVDVNFFPGIILVFISRIFRAQAARRAPQDPASPPVEEQVPPRALNTERQRQRPAPSPPSPESRPTPGAKAAEPAKPSPEAKRQEMLEQILVAGTEMASETEPDETTVAEIEEPAPTARPISSAEMIARAHERWNKRP